MALGRARSTITVAGKAAYASDTATPPINPRAFFFSAQQKRARHAIDKPPYCSIPAADSYVAHVVTRSRPADLVWRVN